MVRLRREIDGISVDPALPRPTYALDPTATRLILPTFDLQIGALPVGRTLIAGVPTPERAVALAEAGHSLTICDVASDETERFAAALPPAVAAKLTLVDKPYGQASFGPSSFDNLLLLDTLHRFAKPRWVAQKAFRELKFDGTFACRIWVTGPAPEDASATRDIPPAAMTAALRSAQALWTGPAMRVLLTARGRDAVQRGANFRGPQQACDWISTVEAVAEKLTLESTDIGSSARLQAAELLYGARAPVRTLVSQSMESLPATASQADLDSGAPRVIGCCWRKLLGGARFRR